MKQAKILNARSGFFPPASRYFGGGGKTVQQPATPAIASAPAPLAAPPASATSAEVTMAQQDARRQSLKKRGFSKTTFAGDTGGWFAGNTPGPNTPKRNPTGASNAQSLGG